MKPGISSTVEDYLKNLLLEQDRLGSAMVPPGVLAEAVGVTAGTATTMIKTLAEAGLLRYEPRVGVRLTPEGEKLAANVVRRHRLVELFLVQVLKLDWSEVHSEAEVLEHAVSPLVLEKLDELLGHPTIDPHGAPIPTPAGQIHGKPSYPLTEAAAGDDLSIVRVEGQDPAFLRFAEQRCLTPGTEIHVLMIDPAADPVSVRVHAAPQREAVTLGNAAARRVMVGATNVKEVHKDAP